MSERLTPNLSEAEAFKQELVGDFDNKADEVFDKYNLEGSQYVNDFVYHYTTLKGLAGILESKVLWATNYRYLNDTSEIKFGREFIAEYFGNELGDTFNLGNVTNASKYDEYKGDTELDCRRILWMFLNAAKNFLSPRPSLGLYVASFCNNPDQLSQWRAYGSYNIGFQIPSHEVSIPTLHHPKNDTLYFFDVKYEHAFVGEFIRDMLAVTMDSIRKMRDKEGFYLKPDKSYSTLFLNEAFQNSFSKAALRLKHGGFIEEGESRLLTERDGNYTNDVKVRVSNGIDIPYVEIPLDKAGIKLVSIYCGPALSQPKAENEVKMLLKQFGWEDIPVEVSKIPLGL